MLKSVLRPVAAAMLLVAAWLAVTAVQAEESSSGDVAPAGTVARGQPPEEMKRRGPAGPFPQIKAVVDIEIQNDRTFNGRGGADERNVLFTDAMATFGIFLNPAVSVQSTFHFEPVRDPP